MENNRYYENLLARACEEISAGGYVMVSGALGIGTEYFAENLERIKRAMAALSSKGYTVFDQIPYLDIYHPASPHDYATKFDVFYKGIIQSGLIVALFVLSGSKHAQGVRAEMQYAEEKGIPVKYID